MSEFYWLTDTKMDRLRPFFPKSRGKPRVDDWRVMSGIIFIQRNGLMWKHAPSAYGPPPRRSTIAGSGGAGWACLRRS